MKTQHLDSAVQSCGLKIVCSQWLDMGSLDYPNTPDEVKAAAYQAAKIRGYQDEGILAAMCELMGPRYDDDTGRFVLNELKDLASQNPATFE
jgi:hypothetical protein